MVSRNEKSRDCVQEMIRLPSLILSDDELLAMSELLYIPDDSVLFSGEDGLSSPQAINKIVAAISVKNFFMIYPLFEKRKLIIGFNDVLAQYLLCFFGREIYCAFSVFIPVV